METMRDIQIRMKSIDSTRQITETMRLISNRKVQKIKKRMEDNRPYFEQSAEIIKNIAADPGANPDIKEHAYITGRAPALTDGQAPKTLVIVVTADRGLCGGYNANVLKEAAELIKKRGDVQIVAVGTKGRDYFKRRKKNIIESYKGLSENPFYEDARHISDAAIKMFSDGSVDEVYFIYTEYHTMLSQTPRTVRLLPLDLGEDKNITAGAGISMNCDSDETAFFEYAVSAYASSLIFGAMLESAVSEQCARLTGMDSAVKNSEKIIDALTLQYNQMRQGAITQEIAEIVGGANAVGK